MLLEPRLMLAIDENHFDFRQRLPYLELGAHPGRAAERNNLAHEPHPRRKLLVDRLAIPDRKVTKVNALEHAASDRGHGQVLPERLGHERNERRYDFRQRQQRLVERPVGVELIGVALIFAPEAVAAAAD